MRTYSRLAGIRHWLLGGVACGLCLAHGQALADTPEVVVLPVTPWSETQKEANHIDPTTGTVLPEGAIATEGGKTGLIEAGGDDGTDTLALNQTETVTGVDGAGNPTSDTVTNTSSLDFSNTDSALYNIDSNLQLVINGLFQTTGLDVEFDDWDSSLLTVEYDTDFTNIVNGFNDQFMGTAATMNPVTADGFVYNDATLNDIAYHDLLGSYWNVPNGATSVLVNMAGAVYTIELPGSMIYSSVYYITYDLITTVCVILTCWSTLNSVQKFFYSIT